MLALEKSDLMQLTCEFSILLFAVFFYTCRLRSSWIGWILIFLRPISQSKRTAKQERKRKKGEEQTLLTGQCQVFIFLKRSKRYGNRLSCWSGWCHAVLRASSYIITLHAHPRFDPGVFFRFCMLTTLASSSKLHKLCAKNTYSRCCHVLLEHFCHVKKGGNATLNRLCCTSWMKLCPGNVVA